MAKHRYSADKRQKEIKRQKAQQAKKLRREQKGTPEAERDEQALINEYLGLPPEPEPESSDDEEGLERE